MQRSKTIIVLAMGLAAAVAVGCASEPVPGPAGPQGAPGPIGVPGKAAPIPPGPGVKVEITKVDVPADNKPVVTFKLTDDKGIPLKPTDLDANSLRFILAKIVVDKDTGLSRYENYLVNPNVKGAEFTFKGEKKQPALATTTQPIATGDTGGKITETDTGYTYVFSNTLGANFDRGATNVLGVQATRAARAFAANAVFPFVPAGGTPITREVVKTENCNNCHDPLKVHGGSRRETQYCVLCHTSQNTDPQSGNSLEFKSFIHKIHDASNLPSVKAGKPFFINGEASDFTTVVFPQDVRNCTTCHANAKDGDNWKNAPSAAACTACHDNVNLKTGENHPGGPQANDAACKGCHQADSGKEFDASIVGAHTLPNNSKQLRGVKFEIVSVADTKPGQKPTVTFNIKDNAGKTIDPKEMGNLALNLAGPTTDYTNRWLETVARPPTQASLAKDAGGGNFSYTFQNAIPADAKGTYAVGIEGYLIENVKRADGSALLGPDKKPLAIRSAGYNQVSYAAVTDPKPVPRRAVVLRDSCNKCHGDLGNPAGIAIHGGSRRNPEYCVMCHNPATSDGDNRPADKGAPESIQWKYQIHRIHTGENETTPYLIFSAGGAADFSDVRFPGNRADCIKCHDKNTYLLPLPKTAASMVTSQKGTVVSVTQPVTAVCVGCHDSAAAKGHYAAMTATNQTESCVVCHAEGKDFAVSKVHQP